MPGPWTAAHMSLHSTYNEKERHWTVSCFTRFLTSEFSEPLEKCPKALATGDEGGF